MIYVWFFRVVLMVAVAHWAGSAVAQSGVHGGEPGDAVERARKMIFSGNPAGALDLLRPLADRFPDNTDVYFFRGMAAAAAAGLPGAPADREGHRALRDEAVDSYRHIVDRRPDLTGARLELARVLFERGRCLADPDDFLEHLLGDDCDAAAYHFRRALAGELPQRMAVAVSRFLAVIQARKRVSGSFGMSIAPDTNVNAGTSARTLPTRLVNLFTGEPLLFSLDERARETSGVGVIVSAAGGYRHPVTLFDDAATRLRLDGSVYRREHGGRRFDDMTVAVDGGMQFLFPRARASLLAKVDRRWFAGDPVSRGFGPRIEGGIRIGDQLYLSGASERMERRYRRSKNSDGPRLEFDLALNYALTPAVNLGLRGGWQNARTKSRQLRSATRRAGVYGTADLPPVFGVRGFEIGLFYDMLFTRYDEPGYTLITPDSRRDRLSISRVTTSNDYLELFGFVPALSVVHERRETNIAEVFDYRRTRGELTLRRLF